MTPISDELPWTAARSVVILTIALFLAPLRFCNAHFLDADFSRVHAQILECFAGLIVLQRHGRFIGERGALQQGLK